LIIAGDFNGYYKDACSKLEFLGYNEVFPNTCTFERSGNQLDGVFSNAPVKLKHVKNVEYSDHLQMEVIFTIPSNCRDKGPQGISEPGKYLLKDLKFIH
jgi:hypothetical protein